MTFIESSEIRNYPQIRFMKEFLIGHPGFIAGGCFKSVFSGEKPHDVDMFFESAEDYAKAVLCFKNSDNYAPGYKNKNVESFIDKRTGIRIECVKKVFGTPKEIISNFDFTITKFAFYVDAETSEGENENWNYTDCVIYHEKFFEHLLMKRLVVDDKLLYPISSFHRTYKYAKSGFIPCRETKLKIIREIQNLPEVKEEDLGNSFYGGFD